MKAKEVVKQMKNNDNEKSNRKWYNQDKSEKPLYCSTDSSV